MGRLCPWERIYSDTLLGQFHKTCDKSSVSRRKFNPLSKCHSTAFYILKSCLLSRFFLSPINSGNNPSKFHLLNTPTHQVLWLVFCIYDIHLSKMYLLSQYYGPVTILGTGDIALHKTDINPCLLELNTSQWSHSNIINDFI